MDLSKYDTAKFADEGATMEVIAPDGTPAKNDDGTPVTITVLGHDSRAYRDAANRLSRRTSVKMKAGSLEIDRVQLEADEIEKLTACTTSWHGIGLDGVAALPCTPENVKKVYTRFAWLREQVSAFMGERANYLGGSERTS